MIYIIFSMGFLTQRGFLAPPGSCKQGCQCFERRVLCWVGPNFLLHAGPQQRAAPGSCGSSGVSEKHWDRSKDPVHSYTAWRKVSSVLSLSVALEPGSDRGHGAGFGSLDSGSSGFRS